jgi:16S rRNA G966 N2-methylase RsmD
MTTDLTGDPTRNLKTERLTEMAYGYKKTGTLLAAIEFGIFTIISEGARTVPEIAQRTGLPEESVDRLLTVCKALELVAEVDGAYRNLSDVERYLVRSSRTYFGDYLVYQAKEAYDNWKELAREIRGSGAPMPEKRYKILMRDPEAARKFTTAGYNSSISLAHRLAKMFDFSPYQRWLDFAGGSGSYAIAACERYAHLKVMVLEQPNVIPVTREFVARHNLADRINIGVGDFLEPSSYPKGYDLISFITPLQGYMPDELHLVFAYTYEALEPGGTILIVDYMLKDDKTGPLDPALQNLAGIKDGHYMGRVNSGAEFKTFLSQVGFQDVDVCWLLAHQLGVVTARKPS